ncbi:hypothetical protein [Tenacibaculum sp. M341]|uniref:hypothetical protein n=1 Tax=Tenacibaculum sp. M341 TaxID=2530339 RepID=UPI001043D0B0|nr:hypothetical protein [Tenacibaculum sp. M341]TCI84706.1 hypothetical protein EYW44_19905 [Tenacibaculum sp. M341]
MKYTDKIKKDFEKSWIDVKSYFTGITNPQFKLMLDLIDEFIKEGYNSKLRAGQSLYFLKLTRARLHDGNYNISIDMTINEEQKFEIYLYDSKVSNEKIDSIIVDSVLDNDIFNSWLTELINQDIS